MTGLRPLGMLLAAMLLPAVAGAAMVPPGAPQQEIVPAPQRQSPPPSAGEPALPVTVTVVRALDKITARSRLVELPEGVAVRFGTLEIVARHCESRPPEEEPETAAFLEIWDNREGRREKVFSGWMLASSPALHGLEHPVYDVWVIACKTSLPGAPSGSE